jgi:hypothetical protein
MNRPEQQAFSSSVRSSAIKSRSSASSTDSVSVLLLSAARSPDDSGCAPSRSSAPSEPPGCSLTTCPAASISAIVDQSTKTNQHKIFVATSACRVIICGRCHQLASSGNRMHSKWIKYFLLLTFAYWATGAAKYFHELIEHHGGADNCIDDDDDCATVPAEVPAQLASNTSSQNAQSKPAPAPHHGEQDCVVCKNLAAMAVEQPLPVVVPEPSQHEIAVLFLHDWIPPIVRPEFIHPSTGPPESIHI